MRTFLLLTLSLLGPFLSAQVYIVNTDDDIDNGVCNALHCSLREAINASEADGVPSTIVFNIPGVGKHFIVPNSPFPSITENDLTIIGESQSSGVGSIVIDFNYRDFATIPFWKILGKQFTITGIDFTNFLFFNKNKFKSDCIIQFGDPINNSSDSRISNCSFITDKGIAADTLSTYLIYVDNAQNIIISNNNFGTDHTRSFILNLIGYIKIGEGQGIGKVSIDSNVFLNKVIAIKGLSGDLNISYNIFGALDTSKVPNLLFPEHAIDGRYLDKAVINHNFFYGHIIGIMWFSFMNRDLIISNNSIYSSGAGAIYLSENYNSSNYIVDNYAVADLSLLGVNSSPENIFIREWDNFELNIERNDVSYYNSFLYNVSSQFYRIERHIDNKMRCIRGGPVFLKGHSRPFISSVNRDQISGTGNPNDSVVVYVNNTISCPDVACSGGVELGRTRADSSGNWILNAIYPSNTNISAFQFDSDPNVRPTIYSEFSACYKCPGQVKTNFNPTICLGQTVTYRGNIYSESNPVDSFVVKGDNFSICDSLFIVKLDINNSYRSQLTISICYDDTLHYGLVIIHKDHLIDSLMLQSVSGCDSIIAITGSLIGLSNYTKTICDTSSSIKIAGSIFDKNNLSGKVRIPKASKSGCDSVVIVNLTLDNALTLLLPNDTTIQKGSPININANINFNPIDIVWNPKLYLNCDTCLNPQSIPDSTISYVLTLTDENGCMIRDNMTITVLIDKAEIFVPTAFSPNGDNINDIFRPVFKFPNSTAIKVFRIFDRWGIQVYEKLNGIVGESFGWDGTANGEKMNPGVYIYTIQFIGDDKVLKWKSGDITLIR